MPRGQLAADVPEFLEVDEARALGDLGLVRGVAARAAAAFDVSGALLRLRQREQLLGHVPGARDQIVGHAVIGNHREAEALERAPEFLREAFGVLGLGLHRDHGHFGERGIEHANLRGCPQD